jgi:glucose-6-phosphate isomerase
VGLLAGSCRRAGHKSHYQRAAEAVHDFASDDLAHNVCLKYAVARRVINAIFMKDNEIFVFFEPRMMYYGEWLKQLFGESEGKGGRGLFPVSLLMSTDLHSLGQYLQEGKDTFFSRR